MILSLPECSLNQITAGDSRELIRSTMQQSLLEMEGAG